MNKLLDIQNKVLASRDKLVELQYKAEAILEADELDRVELTSLAVTYGWLNACINFNVDTLAIEIKDIEKELEAYEAK